MIITRPLTDEQKRILANKDKPSEADQFQAMKDLAEYLFWKTIELEEKANANLSPIQS